MVRPAAAQRDCDGHPASAAVRRPHDGRLARARPGVALAALLFAAAARAQDPFEIQVYDTETADPGEFGLETHLNYVATGRAQTSPEGEWPTRHVGHFTLEPHVGVFDFLEVGMYLQTAVRPDGPWDWAGFKLRAKLRDPDTYFGFLRLALNGEVSFVPKRYEAAGTGGEIRPILQADFGAWQLLVNPIVGLDFSSGFHPDFEPCVRAGYRVTDWLAVGAEYYSALGAFDSLLPVSEQTHRGFGTLDFFTRFVDVNFGVGGGTGDDSVLVKAIVTLHRAK